MMRIHFFTALLFSFIVLSNTNAQTKTETPHKPFQSKAFEMSFFIVPNDYVDGTSGIEKQHLEYSINASLLTDVAKHVQVGLHYNHIWTTYDGKFDDKFFILGLISRYNLDDSWKWLKVYGEGGLNMGNYCFCLNNVRVQNELPFKLENMVYGSLGLGGQIRLYKPIWLKFSFTKYLWLNKKSSIYYGGLNIPSVGIAINLNAR